MAIVVSCGCGKEFKAKDESAGKRVRCPECGKALTVPEADEEEQEERVSASRSRPGVRKKAAREDDEDEDRDDEDEDRPRRRRKGGETPATSGKAITSFILGLLSMCLPLSVLFFLPVMLLGYFGIRDCNQSDGRVGGKGLAIAGIIINLLSTITTVTAGILFGFGVFAVGQGFQAAGKAVQNAAKTAQTMNNLKQITIAMHAYHDTHQTFPTASITAPGSKHPHSWRVALLPYLEQDPLYRQYNKNEPWDSPTNRQVLQSMPRVYEHPGRTPADKNSTYFQVITGPGTIFDGAQVTRLSQIVDGSSNTMLVVEAANAVPWSKPEDLAYMANGPLPQFGDPAADFFLVSFADASAWKVKKKVDEKSIRAAITRAGGETMPPLWAEGGR